MNTELSPSPAYFQLHDTLLQQRSTVQSAELIQQLNRALLAGEVVSAAFYDLTLLKLLQQRKAVPLLTPKAEKEISAFIDQLAPLLAEELNDAAQFIQLQHKVAAFSRHFPGNMPACHWFNTGYFCVPINAGKRRWQRCSVLKITRRYSPNSTKC